MRPPPIHQSRATKPPTSRPVRPTRPRQCLQAKTISLSIAKGGKKNATPDPGGGAVMPTSTRGSCKNPRRIALGESPARRISRAPTAAAVAAADTTYKLSGKISDDNNASNRQRNDHNQPTNNNTNEQTRSTRTQQDTPPPDCPPPKRSIGQRYRRGRPRIQAHKAQGANTDNLENHSI